MRDGPTASAQIRGGGGRGERGLKLHDDLVFFFYLNRNGEWGTRRAAGLTDPPYRT